MIWMVSDVMQYARFKIKFLHQFLVAYPQFLMVTSFLKKKIIGHKDHYFNNNFILSARIYKSCVLSTFSLNPVMKCKRNLLRPYLHSWILILINNGIKSIKTKT